MIEEGPFAAIATPYAGFATNAATLNVRVRFGLGSSPGQSAGFRQVRLWVDGDLVASKESSKLRREGSETFSVDVASRPDALIRLQGGAVLDSGQEVRSSVISVFVDRTPPQVAVHFPANNQIVTEQSVTVRGTAVDTLSGIASLTVNGVKAWVNGGVFRAPTSLPFSASSLVITATDRAGNTATVQQRVLLSDRPVEQPVLLTVPPVAAMVGKTLRYQLVAGSTDPRRVSYSLAAGPSGMAVDSLTGLLTWTPQIDQVGDHRVTVSAVDAGGEASQSFAVSAFAGRLVASASISAEAGGVITVSDPTSAVNGLSITIPPNALLADTTIRVEELITPPTMGGTSRFFLKGISIDPDGTLLSAPATIRLPYNTSEFRSGHGIPLEAFLTAYFVDPEAGHLEALRSFSVDAVNKAIAGIVSHFSMYVFANGGQLCPPPTPSAACPDSLADAPDRSRFAPAMLIHGFGGDETTWGRLAALLGGLDGGGRGRIDAWRLNWDSRYKHFEQSAVDLAAAIGAVVFGQQSEVSGVNLVAHSFGGLLVRTYLQDKAEDLPYQGGVNAVMTIGTPHQGIGGPFSRFWANVCGSSGQVFITCKQANSGAQEDPDDGRLMRELTPARLPPGVLVHTIVGRLLEGEGFSDIGVDDGLITVAGAALPGATSSVQIARNAGDSIGLCHSRILPGCPGASGSNRNIPMVEIDDKAHVVWTRVCTFLGASERECKPLLKVTANSGGTVVSDLEGINCPPTCSAGYDSGTQVRLAAMPETGFRFDAWSGDCTGSSCTVSISDAADRNVVATFSPAGPRPPARTEIHVDRQAFQARLGQVSVVNFDDVITSGDEPVEIPADLYRERFGIVITGEGGQYVDDNFIWAATDYFASSRPNMYAPGPTADIGAPAGSGGKRTTVTFFVGDRPATVSGFGAVFIDADFPNDGPCRLAAFDRNGSLLAEVVGFSGPNGSNLFRGLITVDADGQPTAAIHRVEITNGGGWVGVSNNEGVPLDDFTFSPPRSLD